MDPSAKNMEQQETNDIRQNSINENLANLEKKLESDIANTEKGTYFYKTEKIDDKTYYIPTVVGVEFPMVESQEEMMQILRATEKLDPIIKQVFTDNGKNDDFYTGIDTLDQATDNSTYEYTNKKKGEDLYIDNRIGGENIFDTKVLSYEGLQKLIPGKNTSFYNNFLDSLTKILNKGNHIYIKNLKTDS